MSSSEYLDIGSGGPLPPASDAPSGRRTALVAAGVIGGLVEPGAALMVYGGAVLALLVPALVLLAPLARLTAPGEPAAAPVKPPVEPTGIADRGKDGV